MAISDTITSMYDNVGNVYDVLELAGADLTNVDKNIQNLKQTWEERLLYFLANGTDVVWNNWLPKVTGSGETITLNNTIEAKMDFVYKGNTYQYSTSGKNLFEYSLNGAKASNTSGTWNNNVYTFNNVTFTINDDFSIKVNGTASNLTVFFVNTYTTTTNNVLNGCTGGSSSTYKLDFWTSGTIYGNFNGEDTSLPNNTSGTMRIVVYSGKTANNVLIKPMIRLSSITDTTYEPYTGGIPSPNPDYPQDIQVVSGDNTIKVEGKNLLNKELIENGKATNDYGTPGAIPVVGTTLKRATLTPYNAIEAKPNTKYTFNMTSTTWRFAIAQMDTDKISLGDTGWQTTTPYTITTSANCRYIGFNFSKTDNTNISDEEFNSFINANLMMFEGESVIPYTPYQSQTYPISLGNIELCKIGTYQDRIYKDSGKWYLHKEIGKVVLDGSEDGWTFISVAQGSLLRNNNIIRNAKNDKTYIPYSNNYKGINENSYQSRQNNQFYLQATIGYLDIIDNRYTDANGFQIWLSTHNTIVYYVLATPTTTEITDTTLISQLEAIKKSYNTQTNISQTNDDKPFILDVVALGN